MKARSIRFVGLCIAAMLAVPALAHAGAAQILYQQKKAELEAKNAGAAASSQSDTVVDVIARQGQFSTFLQALEAAGLTDMLKQPGQYTVFVPTDEAFAQLPAGKLDTLLKDRAQLKQLLAYHIVPQKKYGWDLRRDALKTLDGNTLQVTQFTSPDDIRLNQHVEVLEANLRATNGVVHVIDQVMVPQS
ncbi:MAG TPA: fasciclin domain-containing protein [Burkholderiales bacterium]|nr:fasciclin domain-containing protein [Burkholderiales bacterium]